MNQWIRWVRVLHTSIESCCKIRIVCLFIVRFTQIKCKIPALLLWNELSVPGMFAQWKRNERWNENRKYQTRTDLFAKCETVYLYFGNFVLQERKKKVCCELVTKPWHTCLTWAAIKRNWWQQPKSFEQERKGNDRSYLSKWLNRSIEKKSTALIVVALPLFSLLSVEKSKSIA